MPDDRQTQRAPVRSMWSGTITFGLVSVPVDLYAAARGRQTSLKLVDAEGNALGRRYVCEKEGKPLGNDELVRGYQTEDSQLVVVTDEELETVAPEMSRDIELQQFVKAEALPSEYFDRPYFLAPSGRSSKAYTLLAHTMERTGKVAIGRFVMREHEYLVALLAEGGVLRAQTLRTQEQLRHPEDLGLPKPAKAPAALVKRWSEEIGRLTEKALDLDELEDRDADRLHALAERKARSGRGIVEAEQLEDDEPQPTGGEVVDLVALLRKSLGNGMAAGEARSDAPAAKQKSARTRGHAAPKAKARSRTSRRLRTAHEKADRVGRPWD